MIKKPLLTLAVAILLITAACDRNNPYDPESDNYKQVHTIKDLSVSRTAYGFAALDTTLFMIGGLDDGTTPTTEVRGYVPSEGERDSSIAALPTTRTHCLTVTHKGRLYVFGGKVSSGIPSAGVISCAPGDAAWKTESAMPGGARYDAAGVSLGNYIYIMGGHANDSTVLNRCDRYDPAAGVWFAAAPMAIARTRLSATISGGLIIAAGGENGTGALDTVETYDPATDTWTAAASLRGKHHSFVLAAANGYLFALDSGNGYQNTFEERDSIGGAWRIRDLTEPDGFTTGSPAAVIDSKIYFTDGNNIYLFLP